jgi:hypothetical protein
LRKEGIIAQIPTISVGIPRPSPQPSWILSLVLYLRAVGDEVVEDEVVEDEVVKVGDGVCPAGRVAFTDVIDTAIVVDVATSATVLEDVCEEY